MFLPNYIETGNPFGLSKPPDSFLRALLTMDPDLVIFPSMTDGVYRLARRARNTPGILRLLQDQPDKKVLFQHRLVPVTAILPGAWWGPRLLEHLAQCDMWRMGGADKVADRLEEKESRREADRDLASYDEAEQRAVSAWDALKLRQGHTVFLADTV